MAKTKEEAPKKKGRPSKKQVVAEKKQTKKTTEKKPVKKNNLTSEKKSKKVDETVEKVEETVVENYIEPIKEIKTQIFAEIPITKVEEPKKKIEEKNVVKQQSNPNSISPVDDDDDDEKTNQINNPNNSPQKVYTCKKGAVFMEGHLKIQIDDTNISRKNDTIFDVFGKSEHGAEYKTEFECHDKEEGDFLAKQLSDYEKNPAQFITEVTETEKVAETNTTPPPTQTTSTGVPKPNIPSHALDANGNIDMTKLTAAEIMSIQNGNISKVVEEKKTVNFEGVPVTAVNIEDMINNLPPKPENQNIIPVQNTINDNISAKPLDFSNIMNSQILTHIRAYGKSVQDSIDGSFQANSWGGMPQNDVRSFLKNCDGQYIYELLSDGTGFFINMKKDSNEIRIPENPNEYLKVK